MSWTRPAISRRDHNDEPLAKAAREAGCILVKAPPLDYWIFWSGLSTHWVATEIKDPKREGHKKEYTPLQIKFMQQCRELNVRYEIWRTTDDVADSRSWHFAKARG